MANSSFDLSDVNGSNGFAINTVSAYSVSNAGDINNDGIDDLIIGNATASPNGIDRAGQSYVLFGGTNVGSSGIFNLSELNGTNGFSINGIAEGSFSGNSVSNAGDINNDGIDDLIIAAPFVFRNSISQVGQIYLVFGGTNVADNGTVNFSLLNGTNGFTITGINDLNAIGNLVSNAGDINNDGIDDLITVGYDISYVVFGGTNVGSGGTLNPSSLDGSNGFTITKNLEYSYDSVSNAGDINNDGIDDLIIGTSRNFYLGESEEIAAQSYVIFGGTNVGSGGIFNLSELNGINGFAINAIPADRESDLIVSNAGDINNDGVDDLIIGSFRASPNDIVQAGQTYVVFGGTNVGSSGSLNVSDLNGTNGFAINGITENGFLGSSVSNAGDINADGIDDLIIGSSEQTYVVFGGTNVGSSGSLNVSDLNGTNGFSLENVTEGGEISVSSYAGDINNDGVDDLIIGGYSQPSYVLFGGPNIGVGTLNVMGTPSADALVGSVSKNIIDGKAGNDTLTGNGSQDKFVFRPGDGNDTITDFGGVGKGRNPSVTVIGKVDTLKFTGSGLTAENLQLTQNGNNLEVTFENVANIKVTLQNLELENLDNLPALKAIFPAFEARPAIGNILFDGQTSITDSFDVFDANSTQTRLFDLNTVTFLNNLDNNITGFDNSADVVNGQEGNDKIDGKSGNDLLRGGTGNDTLIGGTGNDTLVGGAGADRFLYNTNSAFASSAVGVDTIADFKHSQGDKIILDKTTFSAITSTAGTDFSNASDFQITSSGATSTAIIAYDAMSGQLFYNQNGSAAGFGSGGSICNSNWCAHSDRCGLHHSSVVG